MCVLALHLAKELCRTDEDGEHWVSVMKKVPVLPSVLSAVELSLRSKRNLYFTEAALHLLLILARTPQVDTTLHVSAMTLSLILTVLFSHFCLLNVVINSIILILINSIIC